MGSRQRQVQQCGVPWEKWRSLCILHHLASEHPEDRGQLPHPIGKVEGIGKLPYRNGHRSKKQPQHGWSTGWALSSKETRNPRQETLRDTKMKDMSSGSNSLHLSLTWLCHALSQVLQGQAGDKFTRLQSNHFALSREHMAFYILVPLVPVILHRTQAGWLLEKPSQDNCVASPFSQSPSPHMFVDRIGKHGPKYGGRYDFNGFNGLVNGFQ